MNSRVLFNLAPVNLGPPILLVLVMEEEWSLNGHHLVHGDKDKGKEKHDGQDADKGAWAQHFLNVHVVERQGANLGDGGFCPDSACSWSGESFGQKKHQCDGVCGCHFHY